MNNLYLGVFTTEKADYYNFIKENLKDVHVYGEGNFAIYGDMLRFDEHPHLPYFIPWNNEGYELYDDIMFKIVIYALPNNENIIMTRGLFRIIQ
jgi:hypothetical protein